MTQNETTQSPAPDDTFDPDSEQDRIDTEHEASYLTIEIPEGTCACGCGQQVSKKARFRMGHDQRFMGMLAGAHHEGKELAIVRGGVMIKGEIMNLAADYLSATGQTKLRSYLDNASARPSRSPKRYESDPAKNQGDSADYGDQPELFDQPALDAADTGLGAPVRVKVGRWEYDGVVTGMNQAGKVTAVEYQSKSGTRTAQDGQFTLIS